MERDWRTGRARIQIRTDCLYVGRDGQTQMDGDGWTRTGTDMDGRTDGDGDQIDADGRGQMGGLSIERKWTDRDGSNSR